MKEVVYLCWSCREQWVAMSSCLKCVMAIGSPIFKA